MLLSIRGGDEPGFERNYAQLRAYYGDAADLLPPSAQQGTLTALHLLRLLVQNRIAEFHTELEGAAAPLLAAPEVAQVVELEQWLMEGAYNKAGGAGLGAGCGCGWGCCSSGYGWWAAATCTGAASREGLAGAATLHAALHAPATPPASRPGPATAGDGRAGARRL